MLAGRAVQETVQFREDPLRGQPAPARRQELLRQARIQIRQPAPLGEQLDVVREGRPVGVGPGRRRARRFPAFQHGREAFDELRVERFKGRQVPPAGDFVLDVPGGQVLGLEELHIFRQPGPLELVADVLIGVARGNPEPRGHGTEAHPGQHAAQLVAEVALGFRDGEGDEEPAVGRRRPPGRKDAAVAFLEDILQVGGQPVGGHPALPDAFQHAAALEPGHGRAHPGRLDAEVIQHGNQHRDGQRAAVGAPVQAVDRDDQLLVPRGLPGNGGFAGGPASGWASSAGVRLRRPARAGSTYHRWPFIGRTVMDLGYRGLRAADAP